MPDTTTIYITKGAEAHGIRKARAVVIPQGLACLVDGRGMALPNEGLVEPDDFTESLGAAKRIVQQVIWEKIAAAQAEISRLQAVDLTKVREG